MLDGKIIIIITSKIDRVITEVFVRTIRPKPFPEMEREPHGQAMIKQIVMCESICVKVFLVESSIGVSVLSARQVAIEKFHIQFCLQTLKFKVQVSVALVSCSFTTLLGLFDIIFISESTEY